MVLKTLNNHPYQFKIDPNEMKIVQSI